MPASVIDAKITISGLEDAKAKLTEAGATGEAAFGKIGQATATAGEGVSQIGSAFEALGEKLGLPVDAVEKFGAALGGMDFEVGLAGLAGLGASILAAGVAFMALGENAARATREIENQARILGITTEAYEGLNFAAASVGVGTEELTRGMDRFQAKIGQAREAQDKLLNGGKPAFDSAAATIEQIASLHLNAEGNLEALADAMKNLADPEKQAALGLAAMSRGWAALDPLLLQGGDAIRKHAEDWKKLGLDLTEGEKKMGLAYASAAAELGKVTEALKNAFGDIIGQLFTPGMEALSASLAQGAQGVRDFGQAFVDHVRPAMQAAADVVRGFVATLQDMTAVINKVFGTNFLTVMVVATALLVTFARPVVVITSAFLLLEAAIKAALGADSPINAAKLTGYIAALGAFVYVLQRIYVSMRAIVAVASWPLALIAGLGALVAVLVIINSDMRGVSDAIRKYIGEDAANTFDGFVEMIRGGWKAARDFMIKALTDMGIAFDNWVQNSTSLAAGLLRIIEKVASALSSAGGATAGLSLGSEGQAAMSPGFDPGQVSQHARGGRVAGSGIGDIVRALLTPGEFVHRVAAVRHYGLDFMQRLNNLQIPRFDTGGVVSSLQESFAPTQRFASGGMVEARAGGGATHVLNITIGSETFAGLIAPADVAKKLVTFARGQVVQSAGRAPGWAT